MKASFTLIITTLIALFASGCGNDPSTSTSAEDQHISRFVYDTVTVPATCTGVVEDYPTESDLMRTQIKARLMPFKLHFNIGTLYSICGAEEFVAKITYDLNDKVLSMNFTQEEFSHCLCTFDLDHFATTVPQEARADIKDYQFIMQTNDESYGVSTIQTVGELLRN